MRMLARGLQGSHMQGRVCVCVSERQWLPVQACAGQARLLLGTACRPPLHLPSARGQVELGRPKPLPAAVPSFREATRWRAALWSLPAFAPAPWASRKLMERGPAPSLACLCPLPRPTGGGLCSWLPLPPLEPLTARTSRNSGGETEAHSGAPCRRSQLSGGGPHPKSAWGQRSVQRTFDLGKFAVLGPSRGACL